MKSPVKQTAAKGDHTRLCLSQLLAMVAGFLSLSPCKSHMRFNEKGPGLSFLV